jgi:hypothetical protein
MYTVITVVLRDCNALYIRLYARCQEPESLSFTYCHMRSI